MVGDGRNSSVGTVTPGGLTAAGGASAFQRPTLNFMANVGTLVPCTAGGWMLLAPTRCPAGHPLSRGRFLVGHQPCGCPGGHTTWTCLECDAVSYAPTVTPDCRLLAGAAAVW